MSFRFKASRAFWKSLSKLPERQQASAKAAFKIFKTDPFDPRLRSHRINSLSAFYSKTVYAAEIEGDLRVAFYVEGNVIFTVDIGSHAIYRV
jgi:mRNA-degrading endonuclease YafQ of YafQ-DinJ toxin-antitoxin module